MIRTRQIKVEVGGGNRILKVTDAASNASEAERITLAKSMKPTRATQPCR